MHPKVRMHYIKEEVLRVFPMYGIQKKLPEFKGASHFNNRTGNYIGSTTESITWITPFDPFRSAATT